jgi:hypothetical protein
MTDLPDSLVRLAAKQDLRVREALGRIADGAEALHHALAAVGAETPGFKDLLALTGPDLATRAALYGLARPTADQPQPAPAADGCKCQTATHLGHWPGCPSRTAQAGHTNT